MISNRSYVLLLTLLLLAFVPAILLRDFNLVNELNYLGIAEDALERGAFFTFFQDGTPYADKPPTYLWLCMLGLYLFGPQYAMSFLLLISVLAFIFTIALMDRAFGSDFRNQERLLLIMGCGALLFADVCALIGRMDMLFAAVMLFAYTKLIKRYSLIKTQKAPRTPDTKDSITYGNLAIPLFLFLGIFIKGPYALIMPVVALILVLAYNHDLKRFFAVFRPYYLVIILVLLALWALGVYLEGGREYLEELFVTQSSERLAGNVGHPKPPYYFLVNYPLLTLPVCLSALYFLCWHLTLALKARKTKHTTSTTTAAGAGSTVDAGAKLLSLKQQACLFFFISVLVVVSIPSSKLEIYLLPGVLPLFYYVALSYRQLHAMRRGIDLTLEQNYLILPAAVFQKEHSATHQKSTSATSQPQSPLSREHSEPSFAEPHASQSSGHKAQAPIQFNLAPEYVGDEVDAGADAEAETSPYAQYQYPDAAARDVPRYQPEASWSERAHPVGYGTPSVSGLEHPRAMRYALEPARLEIRDEAEQLEQATAPIEPRHAAFGAIAGVGAVLGAAAQQGKSQRGEHGHFPVQHWGLEIEGNGFMLSGLKIRSERVALPLFLQLSLLLPLLCYVGLFGAYCYLYPVQPILQEPLIAIAFGVLAFCSLAAIFFMLNRLFLFALATSGIATLGLVFFLGLAMPFLNNFIGVGTMVSKISAAIDQGAPSEVCVFDFRNAYAIKVYDPRLELFIDPETLDDCIQQSAHIMFSYKAIKNHPEDAERLQALRAKFYGNNLLLVSHNNRNHSSLNAPVHPQQDQLIETAPQTEATSEAEPIAPAALELRSPEPAAAEIDEAPAAAAQPAEAQIEADSSDTTTASDSVTSADEALTDEPLSDEAVERAAQSVVASEQSAAE